MPFDARRVIAKLEAHTELDSSDRLALAGLVTDARFWEPGHTLAASGDPLEAAVLVLEGVLARTRRLADGRRQIVGLLFAGDAADAVGAVLPRRDDDLETLSAVAAAIVPQSRISALCEAFPRLREALQREALMEASRAREWMVSTGRRAADEALAHLICELWARSKALGQAGNDSFEFPLTQQQVGDCLGLSTVHVNRVFRQLRVTGLLRLQGRRLSVVDGPGLQRLAAFESDYLHLAP